MKKIGIDARLYSQTGVGVYLRNLLYYLQEVVDGDEQFFVYLSQRDFNSFQPKNPRFVKKLAPFHWHSLAEQSSYLFQLNQDRLDLMHFTYFGYPAFYRRRFIATIHDLTPMLFRTGKASTKGFLNYTFKYFFFEKLIKKQINQAQVIITPTETVKEQIINCFRQIDQTKIQPIYEGVNQELIVTVADSSLNKTFQNFFLYVGNFYPHKNVEFLIETFTKVDKGYKLILVGPDDFFTARIRKLIDLLNQKERIIIFNNAKVEQLAFFYKNAQALIYPSLSEGFGLPLIEAAYFNLPIVATDIPVFHELLDNQYLSFKSDGRSELLNSINQIINGQRNFKYEDLLARYSFKKMTEETYRLYQKALI
jgi:glycosyltransferase involved in cell wall biosynthesis